MYQAIRNNDIETVKKMASDSLCSSQRMRCLLYTLQNQRTEILSFLVKHGWDINMVDSNHRNIVHNVIIGKNTYNQWKKMINMLIDIGYNYNTYDTNGKTTIDHLCDKNDVGVNMLRYLIEKQDYDTLYKLVSINWEKLYFLQNEVTDINADINTDEKTSLTAVDVVKKLHANGMNIKKCDTYGWLPIHYACQYDDCHLLKYVIENKLYNINQYNLSKKTPLIIGIQYESTSCVSYLCTFVDEIDVGLNVQFMKGNSFEYCIHNNLPEILEILLLCLLKQQGITDLQSYRANRVVTFEFLFNLYRYCVDENKVSDKLHHWLDIVVNYWKNLSINTLSLELLESKEKEIIHPKSQTQCILCLNPIATEDNFIYYYISDCFVCQQCSEKSTIAQDVNLVHQLRMEPTSVTFQFWQTHLWRTNSGDDSSTSREFFQSIFASFAGNKDISMMQFIVENPPGIDNLSSLEWTAAHTVAYAFDASRYLTGSGVFNTVQMSLKEFFNKNESDLLKFSKRGNLPIHLACQMNNYVALQIMIDVVKSENLVKMINAKKADKFWQYTPLIIAIKYKSIECVKILINDNQIDLSINAMYPNWNALEFASYENHAKILKLVYLKGKSIDDFKISKNKLIDIAVSSRQVIQCNSKQCVELLLGWGTSKHKSIHSRKWAAIGVPPSQRPVCSKKLKSTVKGMMVDHIMCRDGHKLHDNNYKKLKPSSPFRNITLSFELDMIWKRPNETDQDMKGKKHKQNGDRYDRCTQVCGVCKKMQLYTSMCVKCVEYYCQACTTALTVWWLFMHYVKKYNCNPNSDYVLAPKNLYEQLIDLCIINREIVQRVESIFHFIFSFKFWFLACQTSST